ncbi:hypothetical protein, partial, partial [Absidia glauca]
MNNNMQQQQQQEQQQRASTHDRMVEEVRQGLSNLGSVSSGPLSPPRFTSPGLSYVDVLLNDNLPVLLEAPVPQPQVDFISRLPVHQQQPAMETAKKVAQLTMAKVAAKEEMLLLLDHASDQAAVDRWTVLETKLKTDETRLDLLKDNFKSLYFLGLDDIGAMAATMVPAAASTSGNKAKNVARVVATKLPALQFHGDRFDKDSRAFNSVQDFLDEFEDLYEVNGFSLATEWEAGLMKCLHPEYRRMAWANLDFKNISWEEAKDKLIAKYGQDREVKDYRELLRNLVIGKTEQVAHFFDRWENLRLEGQLQDSSDLAKMLLNSLSGNQFLQKTLFSHLLVHSGGLFTSAEHLKGVTMDLVRSPVWTMMVDNLGAPSSGVSSGARPSSSKRTDGNCPTHGGKSGSGADHDLEECKAYVDQKRRQHDRVDDRRQRRNQRSRSRSGSRDDYSHHHKSKHYQQYRRDHHQQRDQQHRGGNRQDRDARSSNGAPYPKHHKNKTWSRDSKDNDKPTDSYGKKFYSMKAASRRSPSATKTTTSGVRVSPPPAGPSSLVPDADAIMHDGQRSSGKKFCMMKGVKQETKDDDSPSVPLLIQDVEAMAL